MACSQNRFKNVILKDGFWTLGSEVTCDAIENYYQSNLYQLSVFTTHLTRNEGKQAVVDDFAILVFIVETQSRGTNQENCLNCQQHKLTMSLNRKKVETVLGPVDPETLGVTLVHEHLMHKATSNLFTQRKPDAKHANLSTKPFAVENLWWINYHPYSCLDNLVVNDDATITATRKEMSFFKENGGGTIVECTTFGRDSKFLKELAMKSGVNIVAGAGYYVNMSQNQSIHALSVEQIHDELLEDIFFGKDGIKCGIIGELGTCYPVHPFERKVLTAAAEVQSDYPSIPVSIHPGRDKRAPEEVLRIFLEKGGRSEKTAMCHLERTLLKEDQLLTFAEKTSCFLEFDLFGNETSYYEPSDEMDMPSDAVRIERIKALIDHGYQDRILISHDIHTKHRLMNFGGHGFSHILLNVIPKMRMRGYSEESVRKMTVDNPKTWLAL